MSKEEKNTSIKAWYLDLSNHSVSQVDAFHRSGNLYWIESESVTASFGNTLFYDKEGVIAEAKAVIARKMSILKDELMALKRLEKLSTIR